LIDVRAHFDALAPDHNCLRSGVTTAVVVASAGGKDFETFKAKVIDESKTRLLAFLNVTGNDDPETVALMVGKYPQIVVGVTATGAADRALQAAGKAKTIVMADAAEAAHLRPGDICTSIYGLGAQSSTWDARKRGVLLDAGSFWFRIAAPAVKQGLLPDTISTDIDPESILLPRAEMMTTLSKFLNLGMTFDQLIERSTVNAARAIRRTDLGTLSEGSVADVGLIEIQNGKFGFLDAGHAKLPADHRLNCVLTVRNGAILWDSEGLAATDWIKAGPYSNFK
jgi:dihydroorotase